MVAFYLNVNKHRILPLREVIQHNLLKYPDAKNHFRFRMSNILSEKSTFLFKVDYNEWVIRYFKGSNFLKNTSIFCFSRQMKEMLLCVEPPNQHCFPYSTKLFRQDMFETSTILPQNLNVFKLFLFVLQAIKFCGNT